MSVCPVNARFLCSGAALVLALALSACGGGGGGDDDAGRNFSVGGTVSGLTGNGLVLQLNGGGDLAIVTNGPFTFTTRVNDGGGYIVSVRTQPTAPDQFCSVSQGSGQIHADVGNVIVACSAVQALYPQNGGNWNRWVLNIGPARNPLAASDQPCTIDAGRSGPEQCIHAGELRTWNSAHVASCAGLTARDALDAFEWVCSQGTGGTAVFTSTGFRPGKKLSDLIDFTALTWRDNRIQVIGTQSFESPSGKWWSNPIVPMYSHGAPVPGAINVITSDMPAAFDLVSGSALVVQPGRTLTAAAGRDRLLQASIVGGEMWIEGDFDAAGATNGIYMQGIVTSVLRGVRVYNASGNGIDLGGASGMILEDVQAINNGGHGIVLGGGFRLSASSARHNGAVGVLAGGSFSLDGHSRIDGLLVAHNGSQGLLVSGSNTVVSSVTATNNSSTGVWLSGQYNIARGITAVNNGWVGIELSSHNTLLDSAATGNALEGVRVFSTGNRLSGVMRLGALADCGGQIVNCMTTAPSDAAFIIGSGIPAAFVAKVTTDDSSNASDSNGAASLVAITDWLNFDNRLRGWGASGLDFPDASQRGPCASGTTCRIWDWSLRSTDTVLRAVLPLPSGDDALVHRWSAATAQECSLVTGAVWSATASACLSTLLRRTTELAGRGGNGNTLCEAGEVCLHTPNYGAYLGHETLAPAGAPTTGQVPGVQLMNYATNGR